MIIIMIMIIIMYIFTCIKLIIIYDNHVQHYHHDDIDVYIINTIAFVHSDFVWSDDIIYSNYLVAW